MPDLKQTPLYNLHVEMGARIVSFAGYAMPVQYAGGIIQEHLHTRSSASVFDVSHMGQLVISGKGADDELEKLLPISVKGLKAGRQRYGFLTLENGGILDDLMLTRMDESSFYMVVNASRRQVDAEHLRGHLEGTGVRVDWLEDYALIALQGPLAAEVLNKILPGAADLKFMDSAVMSRDGADFRVSRSGYTGEDGFEISMPADAAEDFVRELLKDPAAAMAGLGARDSLRLEAGLCLYGNDIDENVTPVEADLLWAIQKVRREGGERAGGFIGAETVLEQIRQGAGVCRVGFTVAGRVPVRAGAEVFNAQGARVGRISSGGFGASVGAPVAMGYVESGFTEPGMCLHTLVRGRKIELTVTALPFVPRGYKR